MALVSSPPTPSLPAALPMLDHAPDVARVGVLVRQHALTAQLLGVDVVPRYRVAMKAASSPALAGEPLEPPAEHEAVPRVSPSAAPPSSPARVQSVGAPPREPTTASAALFGDASAARAPSRTLRDWTRPERRPGEAERDYRARCLKALRERYEADAPHQHFVTAHSTIVFDDGDPTARLAFVGEAPGEEEDKTGVPFVGRAGQLLNKMIAGMGLAREKVYICNVLKTRPPGNATPTTREAELCEPYLLEQLAIVRPEVIVTLGLPATRILLKSEETMARLRGRWSYVRLPDGSSIPVMPTYHPAYLLRAYTPDNRAKVWSDLKLVLEKLGLQPAASPMASKDA